MIMNRFCTRFLIEISTIRWFYHGAKLRRRLDEWNRLSTRTVGAATSRPQPWISASTWLDGTPHCRGRLVVDPAQSTPKGRFVLRADAIRPCNPYGKLVPFNEQLDCARIRAAGSRPYNRGGKAADGSTDSRPLQGAAQNGF